LMIQPVPLPFVLLALSSLQGVRQGSVTQKRFDLLSPN
jgi:hypothetical protein